MYYGVRNNGTQKNIRLNKLLRASTKHTKKSFATYLVILYTILCSIFNNIEVINHMRILKLLVARQ